MRTLKAIDWTRSETERNKTKYQGVSYGYTPPKLWKTPPLVFPYTPDEKNDLQRLYGHIAGLDRYEVRDSEAQARNVTHSLRLSNYASWIHDYANREEEIPD